MCHAECYRQLPFMIVVTLMKGTEEYSGYERSREVHVLSVHQFMRSVQILTCKPVSDEFIASLKMADMTRV
jgi:hypothetical protein